MPFLLLLLLIGTLAYLAWYRRTTSLTRNCRWRQTHPGRWRCVFCGERASAAKTPTQCKRQS